MQILKCLELSDKNAACQNRDVAKDSIEYRCKALNVFIFLKDWNR